MPSTDTRAALVERLEGIEERLGQMDGWSDAAADIGEAADLLARSAPEERGEGELDGRLREVVWEFVRDFGRNGTKTGRADYAAMVPLDRIEHLRRSLGSDLASPPAPVEGERAATPTEEAGTFDLHGFDYKNLPKHLPSFRVSRPRRPVEGERERLREEIKHILFVARHDGRDRFYTGEWGDVADRILAALASHPVQGEREVSCPHIAVEHLPGGRKRCVDCGMEGWRPAALASHPVQGAGGGEREVPTLLPNEGAVMAVCPTCGNKRCPHASDARFVCTGSNELGQVGVLASPAPSAGGTHYCPVCRHPVLLRAPDGTCGDPECRLAASPAPSAPEEEL